MSHPHWDLILDHIGGDAEGRNQLLEWVASLLRRPYDRLPFLFIHGEVNSGKSIFHEAIACLPNVTWEYGWRYIEQLREGRRLFEGGILCAIEEWKDFTEVRTCYEEAIAIQGTHWVQCCEGGIETCFFPHQHQRVKCFQTRPITNEIPKLELLRRLHSERNSFIQTLLKVELTSGQCLEDIVTIVRKLRDAEGKLPDDWWLNQMGYGWLSTCIARGSIDRVA